MYSLYRAWLLRESVTGCTSPDVLITVGTGRQSHQFAGHRTLLSSQSGYLKSLIASSDTNQIALPNISPDVFAPLLTFIYTGYLDLNPENIYAVLLATHLLHMPRALDLCRSYLIQHQQSVQYTVSETPSLIKPIPSRKIFPTLIPPPPAGVYWPPPPLQPPPTTAMPSFPTVFPQISVSNPETETAEVLRSPLAIPSTSTKRQVSPSPSSMSPCLSQVSDSSDHVTVTIASRTKSRKHIPSENNGKVIVDVACCDGPVRFHRVLNQNYGNNTKNDKDAQIPLPVVVPEEPPVIEQPALIETEKIIAFSEEPSQQNNEIVTVFSCHYCNHTFKSHYCYLKHARRHLNPVSVPTGTGKQNKTSKSVAREQKREVRLLDMNVQYYPCKTCGSKFPSYYFVHKHRKQCHPEEDNPNPTPISGIMRGTSTTGSSSQQEESTV